MYCLIRKMLHFIILSDNISFGMLAENNFLGLRNNLSLTPRVLKEATCSCKSTVQVLLN